MKRSGGGARVDSPRAVPGSFPEVNRTESGCRGESTGEVAQLRQEFFMRCAADLASAIMGRVISSRQVVLRSFYFRPRVKAACCSIARARDGFIALRLRRV